MEYVSLSIGRRANRGVLPYKHIQAFSSVIFMNFPLVKIVTCPNPTRICRDRPSTHSGRRTIVNVF